MARARLTPDEARRILVRAQGLSGPLALDLVETVDRLAAVRIDQTAAICPSADHILYARMGPGYAPDQLVRALDDRVLVELDGFVRPMDDMAIWLPMMRQGLRSEGARAWLESNARFHAEVLAAVRDQGPSVAGELPDTADVPWPSSGWTNEKNVQVLLEVLHRIGEVAVVGHRGRARVWDLAERVYPDDLPVFTPEDSMRMRDERRLAAAGLLRPKNADTPLGRSDLTSIGLEAEVEGVSGEWRVDPDWLEQVREHPEPDEPRTVLLTPLDALCFDRDRLLDLFDYEYALEMYKPAAKRRWGYFALPILDGERFVGKLDAKAEPKKGVLTINAVHEDWPWRDDLRERVEQQIDRLAEWLGLERVGV